MLHTIEKLEELKKLIKQLYGIQKQLRSVFPELEFTLDGKIVGDIGEAIAMQQFGLSKLPGNTKTHDLLTANGKMKVQVKATLATDPNRNVGMGWNKEVFDHLLVLQIKRDGECERVFDGPGHYIENFRNERPNRKTLDLTINQLRNLHSQVRETERLAARLAALI
jgi:hypothetical protein